MKSLNLYVKQSVFEKSMKKSDLPFKVCVVCKRPFSWRKKWAKVWQEVKYCSEKCRKARTTLHKHTQK